MSVISIIRPPAYVPTEQEHKIAYLTYMLDYITCESLLSVWMSRNGQLKEEYGKQELDSLLSGLFDNWDKSGNQPWECLRGYNDFKQQYVIDLAEAHCGDCVCVSCPCSRCWAEDRYKIPNTATWKDGHEGHRLFNEYLAETKQ